MTWEEYKKQRKSNSSTTANTWNEYKKKRASGEIASEDIAPVKRTNIINETNADGYTYFGKTFGDYDYHNFSTMGNYKIYKKDDNYYYYDEKNKQYKTFGNINYLGSESQYDNDYEQATKSGKTYDYSKISMMDKLKLDSTDLTKDEYSEYSKDLARQQEKKAKEYERKYAIQRDTPGIERIIQTGKNAADKVSEQIIEPVSNLGELYQAGKKTNDLSLAYYKQMSGEDIDIEKEQEEYDKYAMFNQDLINDKTWGGTAIKNANVQVESIKNQGIAATILGGAGAAIGAGVGAITGAGAGVGAITGARIGGKIGYVTGSMPYTYKLEAGNEYQELKQLGVDDETAKKYSKTVGIINALIESGENVLDLITLGKAGNLTTSTTDDMVNDLIKDVGESKTKQWLASKFGEEQANKIISVAIKAGASYTQNILSEGGEETSQELVSILGERLATKEAGIDRNVSWDEDVERMVDSFVAGAVSTALTAPISSLGGAIVNTTMNNVQTQINNKVNKTNMYNQAIDNVEQQLGRKLTNDEKTEIKSKVDYAINEAQNIQINDSQKQFTFNKTEAKNVKTEKQNVLANDMQRLNNTEEVHKLYNTVNAIQKANDTQQYHITTTEGLYEMGLVDKTEDGKYVMKDGSPYVPRGLNYKNGDIYINADVGSESGTQAMYHEMFEGFKKASPTEYKQFQQMVIDIVGEQTIQDNIQEYTKMYGNELTDNIIDEIINDEFGKLAESQEFINKIADNRNVLEKFIDAVKNMVRYIKGTKEERELIKLQKNLEKEFAKRYKATDFSNNKGNTAYSLENNYRGSHQIENAKSITELNLDDVKNKVIEIDGYLTNQSQSDLKKLQKILNNSDEKVKIYRAAPVNELNSGDWVTTDKSYAQNVADNNGGKVYTFEVKASDLYYPDNVRELPSLHRLSSFQYNGENANQTRYSLAVSEANTGTDNEGKKLSEGQKEFFENSKATDENGNLIKVYHTTTDEVAQFNEFNPVGTQYYRFGDQVVNYYTNSKDMSGSYASQDYVMADTTKINNRQELDNYLKKISDATGNMYNVEQRDDGKYIVSQDKQISKEARDFISKLSENEKQQMLNNIYEDTHEEMKGTNYERVFSWNYFDKDLQQKYHKVTEKYLGTADTVAIQQEMMKYLESPVLLHEDSRLNGEVVNLYDTESDMYKNIKSDLQKSDWSKNTKIQYEGYVNILNPYVIDAEQRNWNQVISQSNDFIDDLDNRLSQETKDKLTRLYNESSNISNEARDNYEKYQNIIREIDSDYLTSEITDDTRKMNHLIRRMGIDDVIKISNGQSVGVSGWYTLADVLQQENVIGEATSKYIIDEFRVPSDVKEWIDRELYGEINYKGIKNLKELYEKNQEAYNEFDKYRMPNSYFIEKYSEDNSEYVDLDLEDMLETRAEVMGADAVVEELAEASSVAFSKPELIRLWGTSKTTNDVVQEIIASNKDGRTNYDGVIIKNVYDYGGRSATGTQANDLYVTFNSNQFKAVDNLNPTEDADIRYSMTSNENIESKEIAPIRQDLSKITEQMNNLSNQVETLQNELKNKSKGYVETYKEQRYENIPTKATTEKEANTFQDALMQDEGYLKSLDEQANLMGENTKLVNKLTDDVTKALDLNKNQKETVKNIINEAIKNGYSTDEISQALQKEFSEQSYEMTDEEAKNAKKLIRSTPINVSDAIKADIADYGKWKQSNFGKITFSRSGMPVDAVYAELSSQMPHYFPSDIINPTDQLQRIVEVANMATKTTETFNIDADKFDNIADYIKNTTIDDEYNAQLSADYDLQKRIQFNMNEEMLPTTLRTQESIDNFIEGRDIAPTKNQKSTSSIKDKINNMKRILGETITNRNYVIDETAKATGNKEIKFAGDMLNNAYGEAQYNINNKQTDINGNVIGKGVSEIFNASKNAGLYAVFNDYLFNKSNIERHKVGKGSQVPQAVSEQLVKLYDTQYPQLNKWAKDVYKYYDNVLQEQVDAGLITQEQYNNYRGEKGIYRSYTPFYEEQIDTKRYFDNDGNIRPVSTLKKSKGNATDVNQLLSMEDAMAKQTYAYKRAIRQNELYKQIVSSLDKYNEAMDVDVRDNPNNLQDNLYVTPDGEKVLSAYIDGEKVSAIISDELFNELSQENENRIKQLEEDFSLITKPLQKVSNIRRNLLTTWNPTFLARNAIKDIQDAVINSKHTADMLKNYFGIKKGEKSAITELRKANTKEAQQFLALYGADNLYGDYSKTNKFSRINELIELAPRFAEFKASLQNGESVQEAIYNAREVTTNFGRGGYITKALNRNGFTFLNANVQGLDKVIRNITGQNGVKGVASVVIKGAVFAVAPAILNELLYGYGEDKDKDYEALPDYIKDNYYLIKTDGNNFVRIPKGRITAAIGSFARRTVNAIEGQDDPYKNWSSNAWSQIGVGDSSGLQTIFTPIKQAFFSGENGKAWYGGDIVPTRLQNRPAGEQYDEKTDYISKFLGELFNVSPKKINYVLDQYSGGIGDVLLPMITPASSNGASGLGYLTAPIKDTFVVNSTDDNKYAGNFYDAKEKLQKQSNSEKATDEDKIRYKYLNTISSQMNDLYKERREVQADTTLSNKEKYEKVQIIQNEINNLAKEALSNYKNIKSTGGYASVDNEEYYKDNNDEWKKVDDSDREFTAGLTLTEKNAYYNTKNKISSITQDYTNKTKNLSKDDSLKDKYSAEKRENITNAIVNSGLDNYTKAMVYSKYYSSKEKMTNAVNAGYNIDTYVTALNDIEALREKYSQKNGYSTEYRKQKTLSYINSLDMEIPQKAMLIRQYYTSFRDYNKVIVEYVSNLNIPYEDKVAILKDNGMKVNGNNVSW